MLNKKTAIIVANKVAELIKRDRSVSVALLIHEVLENEGFSSKENRSQVARLLAKKARVIRRGRVRKEKLDVLEANSRLARKMEASNAKKHLIRRPKYWDN